jgi:phosphoribosylaminoimidazolecarboxamide formyltransferase/IMP cyclohydrolase
LVSELFTEVILAPSFSAEAQAIFAKKKNVRLLELDEMNTLPSAGLECKNIAGGLLLQDQDLRGDDPSAFHAVTSRPPTDEEWAALLFGWKVVRWVKSNAIVYCKPDRTLGIGAGQMSRVDAARLGIEKARAAGLLLSGAALASDAFFPFADGLEVAAAAGVTAVIQPGGSVRDQEVIAAANRNGLAMVFTGVRHFRH